MTNSPRARCSAWWTGGSCASASVSGTGTATCDVPASGTCTVNYRLCACTEHDGV
ncbi:MAG: hypothetical protein IPN04_11645 [Rhodoferax sp.]|nr:hypothetical protein [Rhodoferax sp.]